MPKLYSIVFLFALWLAACDISEPGPTVTLRIEGTVTDVVTGAPIEGARVRLSWGLGDRTPEALTDAQGRYTLSYRRAGCSERNNLIAVAPEQGYRWLLDTSLHMHEGIRCTEETQRFDFRLAPV